MSLPQLAFAAARETFATASHHLVAAWIDLFQSMVVPSRSDMRWREGGPGIGRDARIAYSGLLGRYFARAYLAWNHGVHVLVPLDTADQAFRSSPYRVMKHPPSQGLMADWIGLDHRRRLVIVEAKGTFNDAVRAWRGPGSFPPVLNTAIEQVQRTVVTKAASGTPLPSRRWAIASRWGNEHNWRDPTLIAWTEGDQQLDPADYRELAALFRKSDAIAIMTVFGHPQGAAILDTIEPEGHIPGETSLAVGDHRIERGLSALVGPFGIVPLRHRDDLEVVHQLRGRTHRVAVASLSSRYVSMMVHHPVELEETVLAQRSGEVDDAESNFAHQAGLTIAWPTSDDRIVLADG